MRKFVPLLVSIKLLASPELDSVIAGSASLTQQGHDLSITASDKAIINWKEFSIGKGESATFIQPHKDASVFNRVTGANKTTIDGLLSANGNVYLINTNGIYLGETAIINTASFIASTLDITNEAFMRNGELLFKGDSTAPIKNLGTIKAETGDIILIGYDITNEGSLQAPKGLAALAAGNEVLLKPEGETRLFIRAPLLDEEGGVTNEGSIEALKVDLKALGNSPYAAAINHSGKISATARKKEGGRVYLIADTGKTTVNGSIQSDDVRILGDEIVLEEKTHVNATPGGTILVGGEYKGGDPSIKNASFTTVNNGAQLIADAINEGDGGRVIVWSDDTTRYAGHISAEGGSIGGDGGFAEVSGKETLGFKGSVSMLAPKGKVGTLLLDPKNGTIDGVGGDAFNNPENYGDNAAGSETWLNSDVVTALNSANVTIECNTDFTMSADVVATSGTNDFTVNAGRSIAINADLTLLGGNFTAKINDENAQSANRDAGSAEFSMTDGGEINTNGGDVSITFGTLNSTTGYVEIQGATTRANGPVIDAGGGNITITGTAPSTFATGDGVRIELATIKTSGSGTITVTGVGTTDANDNDGIIGVDAEISSSGSGLITLDGTGSAAGTTTSNIGIFFSTSMLIDQTGTGGITCIGRGGSGTNFNRGIRTNNSTTIRTVSGDINITGSNSNSPTGTDNTGVWLDNGTTVTTTSGTITITGTGASGTPTNSNNGINVLDGSTVSATGAGAINLTGTASSGASGSSNVGVFLSDDNAGTGGATISSTGGAAITITGTGGGGTGSNHGLQLEGSSGNTTTISSNSGLIMITGNDGSTSGDAINADSFSNISPSSTANVDLRTQGGDIEITNALTNAGTGDFLIQRTAGSGVFNLNNSVTTAATSGTGIEVRNIPTNLATNNPTFTTSGADISFSTSTSTISGANSFSPDASTGTMTFNAVVGTDLTGFSPTAATINIEENITIASGNMILDGAVVLTDSVTLTNTAGGALQFNSSVNSQASEGNTLTATATSGTITLRDSGTATNGELGTLTVNGNLIQLIGDIETNNGGMSFTGPITLSGNRTLTDTGATGITFSATSTINSSSGNRDLTVSSASGTVTFAANVGASAALNTLSVTGNSIETNNTFTTTSGQTFTGPVILNGDSSFTDTGSSNISFTSTIDSASGQSHNLTASATGNVVSFAGAVGSTDLIDVLSATAAQIYIGANVETDSTQTYTGAVRIDGNSILTGTGISFSSTIDSQPAENNDLRVETSVTAPTFGGEIGGSRSIGAFIADSPALMDLGVDVTTLTSQQYTSAVRLTGDVQLTNSGTSAITFDSTINSDGTARDLTIVASSGPGPVTFTGVVGGSAAIDVLNVNASSITINGNMSTVQGQTYTASTTTLNSGATFGVSGTGDVTFSGTLTGSATAVFDITSSNDVSIGSLTTSGVTLTNCNDFTVTGATTVPTITLTAPTGAVTFTGNLTNTTTFSVSAGAYSVLILGSSNTITPNVIFNNTGGVTIGNANSDSSTFDGGFLSIASTTTTQGTITTSADQMRFTDVLLGGTTTLTTSGGQIRFDGTINNAQALTANAGAGNVVCGGEIGGTTPPSSLTMTGNLITLSADVTTSGLQSYTGPINLLNTGIDFTSSGGSITFNDVVNSSDSNRTLDVTANSGTITFGDGAGTTLALDTFTVNGNAIDLTGTFNTNDADITLTGPVTLSGATTLDSGSGAGNISLSSTLNGAQTFSADGGTGTITFSGAVGNSTLPSSVSFAAHGTGTVTFNGNLSSTALVNNTTAYEILLNGTTNAVTNPVTFGNTGGVTLGGSSSATSTFNGGITSTASTTTTNGTVSTSNDNMTLGVVLLGSTTTLNTGSGIGDISITGTVNNAQTLNVAAGSGTITFSDVVGGTTPPTNISFASHDTGDVNFNANLTTAALTNNTTSYSIGLNGSTNSVTGATTFGNTGGVTLGGSATDTSTFTGGLVSSASTTTVFGSVLTNNQPMTLGAVTLGSNATLDLGSTGQNLTTGVVTGGGFTFTVDAGTGGIATINSITGSPTFTITDSNATTLSNDSTIPTVTITDTTNSITFNGEMTISTALNTAAQAYSVAFNGGGTVTPDTTFSNTGGVTFAGSDIIFTNGLDTQAGSTTTSTTVNTTGTQMDIGPLTLAGTTSLLTSGGALNLNSTINGNNALTANAGGGELTFSGIVGGTTPISTLSATGSTINIGANQSAQGGTLTYNSPVVLTANTVLTDTGNTGVTFSSTVNSDTTARSLTITANNGTVTFDSTVGNTDPLSALTVTANSIETRGNIDVNGSTTTITGPVTLNADTTFTDATGNISFSSTITGNFDLGIDAQASSATVTVSGAINTSGTTGGNVTVSGGGNVSLAGVTATSTTAAGATVSVTSDNASVTVGAINASTSNTTGGTITLQPATTTTLGSVGPAATRTPDGLLTLNGNLNAGTISLGTSGFTDIATADVISVATMTSPSDLTITGNTLVIGNTTDASSAKHCLTVFGDLTLNLATSASVGDIVVVDEIGFGSTPTLIAQKRLAGDILTFEGVLIESATSHILARGQAPDTSGLTLDNSVGPAGAANSTIAQVVTGSRSEFVNALTFSSTTLNFKEGTALPVTRLSPFSQADFPNAALFYAELFFQIDALPTFIFKPFTQRAYNALSYRKLSHTHSP